MLALARLLIRALELVLALPFRIVRALVFALTTRPSFGPLRHALTFAFGYLVFALALVYAVAPLRGLVGQYFLADKLRYDAERWLATAVYDAGGGFVGTFDPRLDSQRDATKLKRKLKEWWLAPVIYRELTRGGDTTPLKQWAANHIWLAQRTGGAPLHGVEITSRVVFGKEAKDLSIAEQFVLASAVNKPIILLPGSDELNEVRLDRWRYLTE